LSLRERNHFANLLHPVLVGMAFSISFGVFRRLDTKNFCMAGEGLGKSVILLYVLPRNKRDGMLMWVAT
jgi:hypothetical protein